MLKPTNVFACLITTAVLALVLPTSALEQTCYAAEGEPIAIRKWSAEHVTVESQWGLTLSLGRGATPAGEAVEKSSGTTAADRPNAHVQIDQTYSHVLIREPNEAEAQWLPIVNAGAMSETTKQNSVRVQTRQWEERVCQVVDLDGLQIIVIDTEVADKGSGQGESALPRLDVGKTKARAVIVFLAAGELADAADVAKTIGELKADLVVPLFDSEPKAIGLAELSKAIALDGAQISIVPHNTVAFSSKPQNPVQRVVLLSDQPWEMPNDLAIEFAAMEKDSRDSQKVFSKLSVAQMNFKPSNGTHTPRWNTEHMMGRQLLFFSQIYHAIDPSIPVMDLNPQQMPPDYKFAHADWDGAEEARQMQRVSDFTRRFAYLLADCPLDEKAPGSRWPTLNALLKQMQRHYSEHTANTVKKFELPDWPKE